MIIYWTPVQFKNLAIHPLTPKPKPPSISVAVIVVAQGEYHKLEEVVLFLVDSLCTDLKHKIKRKVNTRKVYAH